MTDEDDDFNTNDMGLAAYLVLLGYRCIGTKWEGKSCYWTFKELPGVTKAIDEWISHSVLVEPRAYNGKYKELKYQLMSVLRGSEDKGGRK